MERKLVKMLQVPIDALNEKEAFRRVVEFFNGDSLKKIYTPNPEIVMLAQDHPELMEALKAGDLVVPDGIGLILASKLKGKGLKERVAGSDLIHRILIYCGQSGRSLYILGGKPGIAQMAAVNIAVKYPGIVIAGFHHGYFEEEEVPGIIEEINASGAQFLIVAQGAPRQELWIHRNGPQLTCLVAMGVGGCVDIYAGTAKRAPKAFQRLGLEWFYRLLKEPSRYKRMLLLPKFLIHFIQKG